MFRREYVFYTIGFGDLYEAEAILTDNGIKKIEHEDTVIDHKYCTIVKATKKQWNKVKHDLIRNVKSISFNWHNAEKEWNEFIYG